VVRLWEGRTAHGFNEDIVIFIVMLLIASFRYDGGTVFQEAISKGKKNLIIFWLPD